MGEADAFLKQFTESGELLSGGVALAHPSNGKTVRVRKGVPAVTDGPFAEAKEQLAGYYVLDCAGIERATAIVARDPPPDSGPWRCGRSWTLPARRCDLSRRS